MLFFRSYVDRCTQASKFYIKINNSPEKKLGNGLRERNLKTVKLKKSILRKIFDEKMNGFNVPMYKNLQQFSDFPW